MESRFYALNRFIAPDFSVLVPNWTFGAAMDRYRSESCSYEGPLYLLLTPDDIAVLINNSPESNPNAVDLICRCPHEGGINYTPEASSVREATFSEAMAGLAQLARLRACSITEVLPRYSVWMAGDVGFCVHGEPHRVTAFQLQGSHCIHVVASDDSKRIEPIAEQ